MGRKYTWAYINTTAEGDVAPAEGEFGSIQTKDFDGGFKGHANFRYLTSSTTAPTSPLTTHVVKLTGDFAMSGDIFCTGSIYARNYYIKNVGFMDLTGSTKFGDDLGDTHNFKGDVILDTTSKLYFHDEAGGENIYANSDGHLEINAGSILDLTAPTIDINGSTEVQIDAATFDVNGTTAVTIDCTDTSNGISIGTATSAVPISIGHTTSETTVNDNLTVTGDAEVTGDLTVTGESTFNDKVTINQDDGQQGLRINQTGDGIGLDIDASTVTGKAAVKVTTGRTSGGSGFYLNANSVTSGYGLGIDANGLNGANAAALYIQSEINAQQAGHLIRIKNTDDTNDQMQGITIENAAAPDGNYRDFVIKGLSPNDGMRFQADHEGVIVGPSTTRRGKLHIYSSTSDDIGAMIAINSDQAASDRKPQVAFFNSGARKFTVGSDGSDSMKFKMGTTAIDTGTFLEANTSGELIKLGDDTPALNDVLTWNGSKAIWEPNSLTSATQLVNNAGDAVISSVTDVEITLDSNDNSSTHNYFRIIDGDGQTTLSFGEQGQMVMRGLSGSATEGAKLFMSASNSDAANSAEITFRKTHFADGGTFSAGDNLGTLRFQGSDAGIPDTSSIVIVGEVAAGSIPDASAESWSQGAQMGAELKFSLKQTGTNNFNESLILDGLGAQIGGRLYGPTGDHFVLSSDKDFQIRIDEDGGGSHSFQVFNGAGASMLHVLENGATNIVGDLTVAGHDIKNSDNEVCITMDADQRVGIGGVAPAYKLDIDGDIRVRGNDIRDSGAGVAIRFDGSSNTSILGSLNAGTVNASGQLTLQNTLNAAGDVDDPNDFALLLHHNSSDNNKGPGIAFQATNNDAQVGAAIIHEKTAEYSKGHLKFYTKQANTDGTAPELVLTLTDAGTAEFGGGFGSTGMTIYSNGDFSANGTGTVTKLDVGGGYGSSGATIYANGAINADGNLRVDGTILAAGGIAPLANQDLNIKADQRIYFDCDDDADDSTDPAGFYFRNGEDTSMFSVTSGSADGDIFVQIGQNAFDTAALVMKAKAAYMSIFSKDSSANLNLIGPGNSISKDETISQTRIWGQESDTGTTGNCAAIQIDAASSTWSANSDMPTNMYFKVGCDGQNSAKQAMSISGHASTPRVGIGQSNTYPVTQLSVRQELDGNSAAGARSGISIIDSGANGAWAIHMDGSDLLHFTYSDDLFDTIETYGGYLSHLHDVAMINFTGQHRNHGDAELYASSSVGLIVCSTGKIKNLDLSTTATINEALPELSLSTQDSDKRVFGVISDSEDENDNQRIHQVGAWGSKFEKEDNRLIVNSVGEGAVWVCDINGNLDNGDYITTCTVPGHGALQADDLLHNYTVAKITQDCTFDLDSTEYVCEEYEHNGTTYKRAFVACTYHCG